MAKFEKVSKFQDNQILKLPFRKTKDSAGYDLMAAEDCIIPSFLSQYMSLKHFGDGMSVLSLSEMKDITKESKIKPTLVSTGIKCKLDEGTYLELSVRSSTPLKYWLILANGVGIIDKDYYNNSDNEGEIFLQLINLSPFPIKISAGDYIGQGIIKKYLISNDDSASGIRQGGFGSTGE